MASQLPHSSSPAGTRAPELRKDPIFNRWVIFSPARARRPSDFKSSSDSASQNPKTTPSCPFCIGREHDCAPEIFRFPPETSNWKVRVIENLYPALLRDVDPTPPLTEGGEEGAVVVRGFGVHDVVIETPYHELRLSDLGKEEAAQVVIAYKERVLQLKEMGSVRYVQVFKNHGASAGASLSHSHSQMMGLPIVPPSVVSRLRNMKECWNKTGKCSMCEIQSEDILIDKSSHFFSVVPYAASCPFEIWVVPRDHASHFHDIDREKALDLGGLLTMTLRKLSQQLNDPPFNFMIHTSPLDLATSSLPYAHWFLQIVPRLAPIGLFEMASGCYINPIFPEDGAKLLREALMRSLFAWRYDLYDPELVPPNTFCPAGKEIFILLLFILM